MKLNFSALAVAAPVIVMALWVAKLNIIKSKGTEITLPVQAYDPRDILSGHYLTYTVNYGMNVCESVNTVDTDDICVCITTQKDQTSTVHWRGLCGVRSDDTCPVFLRGKCQNSRFIANIERYYLNEVRGRDFQQTPNHSEIKVRISPEGYGLVTDFVVDGKSIQPN